MKISEPVNVMQKRASPPTSSARSLGYACMMLMALASRGAVAQAVIEVTLQPGETTKTIQAPGTPSFSVRFLTPSYYCDWPTIAQTKTQLELFASTGQLRQLLDGLDGMGTNSTDAIYASYMSFWGREQTEQGHYYGADLLFGQQQVAQLADGPLTLTLKNRCVNDQEAGIWINDLRRVLRAYLGLPPPSAGVPTPSTTNKLAPTTPAAIKK